MDERVYSKEKSVYDRIKRNSRLTFANVPVSKTTGENFETKQGEMESKALASLVNLVEVSGLVSLSDIMKHHLTEECQTLFNVNGTFRKTQKSKLLQKLIHEPLDVHSYTALVDIGIIWRFASPTVEDRQKGDGSPYTWGDYTKRIRAVIFACHVDAAIILCVNDPYDHTESIKDDECELRTHGQGHILNVLMESGDQFPSACAVLATRSICRP